ncbi:MAG: 50S ribosomal protein L9, partial [Spirochaeta sp.]
MKVILNADVPHLGEEGDVKDVKSGYARNFLIPRKLGLPYNNASLAVIEGRRQLIEKRREDKRREALGMKERLESTPLTISMTTGRNGKLFGSVNAATIAGELAKQGIEVERKAIEVPENSIKTVGNFKVGVKLYGGETAQLTVSVTSSQVVAEQEEKAPVPSAEAVPAEET